MGKMTEKEKNLNWVGVGKNIWQVKRNIGNASLGLSELEKPRVVFKTHLQNQAENDQNKYKDRVFRLTQLMMSLKAHNLLWHTSLEMCSIDKSFN